MDDRTTIAKDVLCVLVSKAPTCEPDPDWSWKLDSRARGAVLHADALLAELTRTAKDKTPQCPPAQPAPKGPVWRKMTDHPTIVPLHVIVKDVDNQEHFAAMWNGKRWSRLADTKDVLIFNMDGRRWLDLNGFTPEVGE